MDLITLPRVIVLISLIGTYYIALKRDKLGFVFFTISALMWTGYDIGLGAYEQAGMCLFSAITSVVGYVKWSIDDRKEKEKQ